MGKVAYRDIPALIASGFSFQGNSMSGYVEKDGTYTVKSYRTVILEVNFASGEAWLNTQKYSPTTSHHQSVCKHGLRMADIEKVTDFEGERLTV